MFPKVQNFEVQENAHPSARPISKEMKYIHEYESKNTKLFSPRKDIEDFQENSSHGF
jgi:hypothetical protein